MDLLSRREALQGLLTALQVRPRMQEALGAVGATPLLKRVNVPVRGLDRRLDGLRVGQLSDVHVGAVLWLDYLERAVALLQRSPPELLVVTGDLLDDGSITPAVLDILARVRAPYGVFYALGNHENYAGRDRILAATRAHPTVRALVNEHDILRIQGAALHVSGVDYPVGQRANAARAPVNTRCVEEATRHAQDADFRLCLAHHPDDFDEIRARGVELTLSGHTHGGQFAPVGVWMARRMYRYVAGLYGVEDRHLYVSCGTGGSMPLRVGVDAEVTELTLRRV